MRHDFIAIEGPIGVGKTTLAAKLAEAFNGSLLQDADVHNPYLKRFYKQPDKVAFHTQMHFLASRLELLRSPAIQCAKRPLIADFLLDKDRLFAELTLDSSEWWMYSQCINALDMTCRRPDLVIYLQAPLERLVERIERRGIEHEQRIDSHYLQQVIAAYERFFHDYNRSALLIVNAADINLADNLAELEPLIGQIRMQQGGRHYFNPVVSAIA